MDPLKCRDADIHSREMARRCRVEAMLTASPPVRHCLLRMAEHYETKAKEESEPLSDPVDRAAERS